ncbi:MAG: HEAT repeat domain-containing protein, partial [Betaproteobacteria bacterium]|nr:HEAT repeat domain-containing protein [Betaproteobacteria bacterium]
AQTLGKLRLRPAIAQLVLAMEDPYWQVRLKAARSLGQLKAAEGVEALVATLGHSISNLRKEAAIALGEIGDARALPALEQAAAGDADPDVRKMARLGIATIAQASSRA